MTEERCRLGIIVQARTGSTRLPQKIILNFDGGNSILDIILDKLSSFFKQDMPIILATSTNKADDCLEEYAKKRSISFFRGDEQDVLFRFVEAAEKYNLSHIIRICADNPLIHTESIKNLVTIFKNECSKKGNDIDYLSYKNGMNIPTIKTHWGLFSEIVSLKALKTTLELTDEPIFHEHVTNYVYGNEKDFNIMLIPAIDPIINRYDIRLTIDDHEDFNLVSEIYKNVKVYQDSIEYLISFLDKNKTYLSAMNNNINKYIK